MLEPKLPDSPQTHPLIQTIQWLRKPLEWLSRTCGDSGDDFDDKAIDFDPRRNPPQGILYQN